MLTVFRSVFPGGSGPAGESFVVSVGIVEVEFVWPFAVGRWGRAEEETARFAVASPGRSELEAVREAGLMFEALDFATGRAGSGPVGGAIEGREGRGSEWFVMMDDLLAAGDS